MKFPPKNRTRFKEQIRLAVRWFKPGLGVKRWFLLILGGIIFLGLSLAAFLKDLYLSESVNPNLDLFLSVISLHFIPRPLRLIVLVGFGLGMIFFGIWELNRSLLRPFIRPGHQVVDEIAEYHHLRHGPRVVAIGGGHGLSTLLRGLKDHTHNITAVVTVADDGGSSGKLRESLGILPPGDIRNCLAALSNDEALLTQLFQYRFRGASSLEGHSFGNLFITALSDITGSFEEAVSESGRVLSVHGRVLPSTLHNVRLVADMQLPHIVNEVRVEGESRIPHAAGRVRRLWLEPNDAPAFPPVLQAILSADMIVVGPGSLYTSLLPNLLVMDILAAMRVSRAVKIFVCNIAVQAGETDFYSCYDHVQALEAHVGENLFDVIVCNDCYDERLTRDVEWVRADERSLADVRVYTEDLVDAEFPHRHDSVKLAQTLMDIFYQRTGPLS